MGWQPSILVEVVALSPDAVSSSAVRSQGHLVAWQKLTVRDNGMGMNPEVEERIFEPFYTTKEVGRGSGLGLATVWHIVTEAGGRVEVASVKGDGTTFQVYFPVWSAPERIQRGSQAPIAVPAKALRILLAEDDELVARTVVASLRRSAHTVTHFADGTSAWEHLQEQASAYDLLIFDVNMPGIDGVELSRRVRGPLRYNGKILIISGRLTSENMDALTDANVDSAMLAVRNARALVLDLRGQLFMNDARLLRHLALKPKVAVAQIVQRTLTQPCFATIREAVSACTDVRETRTWMRDIDTANVVPGRIVALIDERTMGAMERFALSLEQMNSVTFVGGASAGAASWITPLSLAGRLTVGVATQDLRRIDGGQLQRIGLTPVVDVRPTARGIRAGEDEVVQRAQQWAQQLLDTAARRRR